MPLVLTVDASQATKDATKAAKDTADDAYDQHVLDYSVDLGIYLDGMASCTRMCDQDVKAAAVLS
jgi:hypothetical protein